MCVISSQTLLVSNYLAGDTANASDRPGDWAVFLWRYSRSNAVTRCSATALKGE
jgi:hypothetical protein